MNLDSNAGKKVKEAIEKKMTSVAKQINTNAPYNKTKKGKVISKSDGIFSVKIDNAIYTNILASRNAGTINVNDIVICTIPNNEMSNMYIVGVFDGTIVGFEPITTTTVSSVSTTPTATLVDNNEYIFSNTGITTLGITLSSGYSAGFISSVVFINPSSTPTITITNTGSYTLKYKGDGVSGNVYTPTASTTATMIFNYDGINMNIYISEV
jgi:hypothetical protein